jgi:hypothetical protein
MRAPHFVQLARINGQHFVTACRHGLVHVTWGRVTMRLSRDEFRRLAGLLERTEDTPLPSSGRHGDIQVTCRTDEESELRVGAWILLLSPTDFQSFLKATQQAVRRLDEILASGIWDTEDAEDTQPSLLDQLRQHTFSDN